MIRVNGVSIDDAAVAHEVQHHPAPSRDEAERNAATALAVRELLAQRARERQVAGASEDERIANLLDLDVSTPDPEPEEVARYFRRNALRFMTSPLYEAAHIFFPAHADDEAARADAQAKAEAALARLQERPQLFAELAETMSACSSKEHGGSLGQVRKGDTNPELERAMATMEIGSIVCVSSRHGYHVLQLDRRVPAQQLPVERVRPWIEDHLRTSSRRTAIAQYVQLLVADAKIEGLDLAAADGVLVQ